jgi:glycosyltransferase involved in cell wall biosynthesis
VDSQMMAAAHLAQGFEALADPSRVTLMTAEGLCDPRELIAASVRAGGPSDQARATGRLPAPARAALGDISAVRQWLALRSRPSPGRYDLVVQYHHRFQDLGIRIAAESACPLILRVEALEVSEGRDWGVKRPGWSRLVTTLGETRLFRAADAVAPVSEPLADAMAALPRSSGAPCSVIPNGVDTDLFRPLPVRPNWLADRGIDGRFVVGWVGGFRAYHGLDQIDALLDALEQDLPDAVLCLAGTGPMAAQLASVQRNHPRSLQLLGPQPQDKIPEVLAGFDVCLHLSRPGDGQHYSPLKVLEYLACGRPIVAAQSKTTAQLTNGVDALLVAPGDVRATARAIRTLHDDPLLGQRLGTNGRLTAKRHGSWATTAQSLLTLASRLPRANHALAG